MGAETTVDHGVIVERRMIVKGWKDDGYTGKKHQSLHGGMMVRLQRALAILVTYRIALVCLVVLNVGHALIHGSMLDGGSLDNVVDNLDNWLISQITA